MKKTLILFSLLGVSLASCKKSYTCNCTTTSTDTVNGVPMTTTVDNTSKAYSAKMSGKQAKAACDHEATATQSNLESLFAYVSTLSGQSVRPESLSTTCTLK